MSKTIVRSLLFALAGTFTMNLHATATWSKVEGVPTDWTPLPDNLLLNQNGTTSGSISYLTPVANNIGKITDGVVPTSRKYSEMLGFAKDATVEWDFGLPKTLEKVRITTCDITDGRGFDDIHIADVLVKYAGSGDWVSLGCGSVDWNGTNGEGIMLYVLLEDTAAGHLAEGVTALQVKFGQHNTVAQYYSEIEAVGSSSVSGPVIGSFGIAPAKTKATVSGSIADVGTDATACDVYFALNGAEAVKIAEGVTDAFEYHLAGLTAGTEYAYVLSVSNNASPAKGSVRSGGFTTLAADASTAFWTTGEGVPADWTPLANNVLGNLTGTTSGTVSSYGGSVGLLTDGQVSGVTKQTCGLGNGMSVEWTFAAPKTLEKLRVTSCDIPDGRQYDDIKITDVFVKTTDSSDWVSLGCGAVNWKGSDGQGSMIYAVLEDVEAGCLAENVTALKLVSGTPNNVAQYYAEIEAVGASAAMGPVIGTIDITPAKTKAGVAGTITDVGTDATACDVYLALDGAAAVRIAEGVTGAFAYVISNLTAGTEYAYVLTVSNNAATVRGSEKVGNFTTLAADVPTTGWTTGAYMPDVWQPLADNVFAGVKGTMDSSHLPNGYGTNDLLVLTDGAVPSAVGKNWIVGIQPDSEIDWTLAVPVTLEQLRISSAYLADPHYSGVNIASVKVKCTGSDEWVEIPGSSSGKIVGDGSTKNIICATLADAESGFLAENVTAVKIVFGPAVNVNANYYCEIEAVGQGSPVQPKGVVIIFM